MRHRIFGKQLNVKSSHRRAMLRNLAAGVFEHGQIETTFAKAKAVQRFVEKIISMARTKDLSTRRQLESKLTDRRIFAWVAYDSVPESKKTSEFWALPAAGEIEFNRYGELRKAPRLIEHILSKVGPLFTDRPGGYTRIIKLDKHRLGDASDLVLLQLVGKEDGPQVSGRRSNRRATADKRTAFAAKIRKAAAPA
ncbi:MAG: 50S ribosomal protein L17 [Phycisphaerae bacterium]|nr:50S ribosomal protein L17 [Phycisphaerae bacterium]